MSFLLLKAFHIISVICWFAGLFYLPRLFVYHAMSEDDTSKERFKVMERKLYRGIMTPSLVLTLAFGIGMIFENPDYLASRWMHIKLALVALLVIYHLVCGCFIKTFAKNKNGRSHVFYRWFNEAPIILLIAIVILAVTKPL
jgi:protoporphyrinogen IX oxidase